MQKKYKNTIFVEDNCEGFLGSYNGAQSGTKSFCSALSFFSNKCITSGEGGAFITNDEGSYNFAKCIQGQGQSDRKFIHNELGYNYRITNTQAGLLFGQIEILPQIMQMKADVFGCYREALKDREGVRMQVIAEGTMPAPWMFGIYIPKQKNYETAERFFSARDIEIRPMFYPMNTHTHLKNHPDIIHTHCENAKKLSDSCIILPSYPELIKEEQRFILRTLDEYLKTIK